MDERILVEVYVPIVQLRFDAYFPFEATLYECTQACVEYIKKKRCYHQAISYLYHVQTDCILACDQIVKDCGLFTGSQIILL